MNPIGGFVQPERLSNRVSTEDDQSMERGLEPRGCGVFQLVRLIIAGLAAAFMDRHA
jgi:hypothetical protein